MSEATFKNGDVVVVTGAGMGLGRGIALRLARMGARIAIWDVSEADMEETAEMCRAEGAETITATVDISDEDQVTSAGCAVLDRFGGVFGLVNNAGIFPRARVLESTTELWDRVLRVNLIGTYLCARTLCPSMLEAGRGAVVNIASGAALRGHPGGAHYGVTKAGILSFTKTLALELAPTVRVNCVIPGLSDTAQPLGEMTRDQLFAFASSIPLGRVGQPEDVAAVTAFLLGPDAGFMTGQSIAVNGGVSMVP